MKREFWLERWQKKEIGFHQAEVHPALRAHWPSLRVAASAKVFVPLCGKSRDMLWLRAQGHPVLGVELSPIAVREFFEENGLAPSVAREGRFERYEAEGFTLLCGDFFDLTPADLAGVAGVYDRASLIALPPELRERYAQTMRTALPNAATMLLVTLRYPDGAMNGPPFSVTDADVRRLYAGAFDVKPLSSADVLELNPHIRERGITDLVEQVFQLSRRA